MGKIANIILSKAIKLAVDMHGTQVDKNGGLYVEHSLAVMERMRGRDNEYKIVAVLHDVLEDTPCSEQDLEFLPPELLESLRLLTRRIDESYSKYIDMIAKSDDKIAVAVKLADIAHNLSRIYLLKEKKERDRLRKKYNGALDKFWKVLSK